MVCYGKRTLICYRLNQGSDEMNISLRVPGPQLILTMVAGVCLAALVLPSAGSGAIFPVTTETDDNGPCETDDCSLREAILAANALPGTDTIIVPGGTYTLSIPGPDEYPGFTGDLGIMDDVEILGEYQFPAVIVGDGSDRVLFIQFAAVTISNVTITGGLAARAWAEECLLSRAG